MLSFTPAISYPVGTTPQTVIAADFNNDGRLDLVTANLGSDNVSVRLGSANGTFGPAISSPTGADPVSIAVGDFDGDGILDLATAGGDGSSGNVSILLGNDDGSGAGTGSFGTPTSVSLGSTPTSLAVGDFYGDGALDLGATSNTYYY